MILPIQLKRYKQLRPYSVVPSPSLEEGYKKMPTHGINEQLLVEERRKTIERIVSERNPDIYKKGIEAYKRDLPKLVNEHKDTWFVAYKGSEQVAEASSNIKLMKILNRKKLDGEKSLFVTCVTASDLDAIKGIA